MRNKKLIATAMIVMSLVSICLGYTLCLVMVKHKSTSLVQSTEVYTESVDYTSSKDRVFMTADHLDESYFPDCEKVYSDSDADVAIYYNREYQPVLPGVGTRVIIDSCVGGEITSAGGNYIVIKVDDYNDIHYGLSGTQVKDEDGNSIAYVIEVVSSDELRAVVY